MEDFYSVLPFVPIILIVCAIIIGWIFLSKIFRQYNKLTFEMRKNGTYTAWAKENWMLLLGARLFRYMAIFSFLGFMIIGMADINVPFDALILMNLFLPCLLISWIFYLFLYYKILRSQNDPF
jgi:hypothetical protein